MAVRVKQNKDMMLSLATRLAGIAGSALLLFSTGCIAQGVTVQGLNAASSPLASTTDFWCGTVSPAKTYKCTLSQIEAFTLSATNAWTGINNFSSATVTGLTASSIGSGILSSGLMPGFSGDMTSSSGSTTTLATVNSGPGTFGSSSAIPVITVNGKGLVTAVSTAAPSGTAATVNATSKYNLNGALLFSTQTPVIFSGFGTLPSILFTNGTAAFLIQIGTSNSGSGVVAMPAAPDGWACNATDYTSTSLNVSYTKVSPTSTQSVTFQNYTYQGNAHAWNDGDLIFVTCMPF